MSSQAQQVRSRLPRIAEVAVERARLTVVPRRRQRAARMPFLALVSLVLLGGVVGLLLFNTSMQQASFASTALEQQASTLAARQQSLQMDLEQLRNPQRIATAARKIGMVQAGSPAFLRLGTDKVLGEPSPGTGADPLRIDPRGPVKPASLNPPRKYVTVPPSGDAAGGTAATQGQQQQNSSGDTTSGSPAGGGGDGKNRQ